MMVTTRHMNKNSTWKTAACTKLPPHPHKLQYLSLSSSLPLSPLPFCLFILSLPQRYHSPHLPLPIFPLSLPAVAPLGLMNDLAGGGGCGCGGASRAHRGEETLFLSPPPFPRSNSPGDKAVHPCQEQDGTSLLDYP